MGDINAMRDNEIVPAITTAINKIVSDFYASDAVEYLPTAQAISIRATEVLKGIIKYVCRTKFEHVERIRVAFGSSFVSHGPNPRVWQLVADVPGNP